MSQFKVISRHKVRISSVNKATKDDSYFTWITPFSTKKAAEKAAKRLEDKFDVVEVQIEEVK